jgi:hypothetical protein
MSHSNASKIKSWLLAAAAFAVWAVLLDFLWTRFVINGSPITEAARISHLIHEHGSEIPIFGASTAYQDYVPEILGDDFFNYGLNGISSDVVNALLQIEVKKDKQTPILVGLCALDINAVMGEPSSYAPFARRPEIRQLLEGYGRMEWRYWVPGLRYFGYYDMYIRDYPSEYIFKTKRTVRGFLSDVKPRPQDLVNLHGDIAHRLEVGGEFCATPRQDSVLFDIIKSAPKRTFIMVYSPLHSSCFAKFKNRETFVRHLEKLRSFPNVVVLDCSQMELPDECFVDTEHMNQKGAAEFSRRLADRLRTIRANGDPGPSCPARAGAN